MRVPRGICLSKTHGFQQTSCLQSDAEAPSVLKAFARGLGITKCLTCRSALVMPRACVRKNRRWFHSPNCVSLSLSLSLSLFVCVCACACACACVFFVIVIVFVCHSPSATPCAIALLRARVVTMAPYRSRPRVADLSAAKREQFPPAFPQRVSAATSGILRELVLGTRTGTHIPL